jgi:hypothetical protein
LLIPKGMQCRLCSGHGHFENGAAGQVTFTIRPTAVEGGAVECTTDVDQAAAGIGAIGATVEGLEHLFAGGTGGADERGKGKAGGGEVL